MENKPNSKIVWWQPGLQLFLRLSGWIVVPIIIAVVVGKYLDRRYGTEPWLFLLTVAIAFVISMVSMIRIGFKEFKRIEEEGKKNK